VLKRDFAPGIAASARPLHGLAGASITPARRANPEKKGICAPREIKTASRMRAHVLFSAPILNSRQHCAAFRNY
jgi:hypothetical protein